ncbi:MAG: hypothetical protein U1E70_23585 [Acetobacteraceae bacterium]
MVLDPFTLCGIIGTGCIIFAYFAALQGWVAATHWHFPALNLAGAAMVLVSLYDAWNLPSVLLESFWGVMSLYGLARSVRGRT